MWWIISDQQLLGDLATDDDPSWATDARETMKQRDRGKGRKEIDALDPDEQFDVVALSLMLEPPASCGVCLCVWGGGVVHVALKIMLWALETFLLYVTSGDFVLSSCHYITIISFISSICIASLVVLNFLTVEEEDVTVHFRICSMYTLKFVYEKLQHTTSSCTSLIRTVLLYFFGKTLFSAKYPFRTWSVVTISTQSCLSLHSLQSLSTPKK